MLKLRLHIIVFVHMDYNSVKSNFYYRACLYFQAKRALHIVRVKVNLVISIFSIGTIIGATYLLEYLYQVIYSLFAVQFCCAFLF